MTQTHLGTALITGASSGIGAVYAGRLARRGYDLVLVARDRERLAALASRITTETQRNVEVFDADLGDKDGLANVEAKLKQDATIMLLVNNAGVGTHTPLADSDVDAMSRMIDLNVTALTRLTYAAVPGFLSRGKGAVINISSIVAIAPEMLNGVYGGSKAFVLAFSQSQSQHSEMLALAPKSDRIQTALEYARVNLSKPLRVDDLAKAAHLSTRQFGRIFLSETGESPAKALERLRLEAARNMIERGRHSLETIAREVGFRDGRHLREVFVRAYGTTPQSLRRDARSLPADEELVNG